MQNLPSLKMLRFFTLFVCVLGALCGAPQPIKITNIVPFGEGNVKITFNRAISPEDIKQKKINSNRSTLDIQATLGVGKKNYNFPNKIQIQIAQNSPKIVRVVINIPKNNYGLRFVDKHLYIEYNPSEPVLLQEKTSKKPPVSKKHKGKKVVIDAGHGGKDCGAIGTLKICEKVVTLTIAKLLEKELKKRGYIVYMTRDKDVYLGLRERTSFANNKNADLFISIHANSVPKKSSKTANGVETYFLSTARSERARRVAEKENKDSIEVMNFFSKQFFLNSLNSHRLIASNKLAIDIQAGILRALKEDYPNVLDGGVREGPFWVLAGALMPSVLIEVGYMSHPTEGRRINHRDYQTLLVQGVANGVDGYFAKN